MCGREFSGIRFYEYYNGLYCLESIKVSVADKDIQLRQCCFMGSSNFKKSTPLPGPHKQELSLIGWLSPLQVADKLYGHKLAHTLIHQVK